MSLAPASLTESALRRLEECNTKLVSWGPLPQVEALNAQNRLKVMTALLFVYNQQLSRLDKSALEQLCKVATKSVDAEIKSTYFVTLLQKFIIRQRKMERAFKHFL